MELEDSKEKPAEALTGPGSTACLEAEVRKLKLMRMCLVLRANPDPTGQIWVYH